MLKRFAKADRSGVFDRPHRRALLRLSMLSCLVVATYIAAPAYAEEQSDKFLCLIQPKMTLKLGTQVPGLIREMLVDRGAIVKKGDVIARLESGVEAAAVLLAEARAANESSVRSGQAKVDYQKRKEERMKALRKNDTVAFSAADEAETLARVAENELDEAKVNVQMAQTDVVRAREVLNQRIVRSPIDGVVTARTLGPGSMRLTRDISSRLHKSIRFTLRSMSPSINSGESTSACRPKFIRKIRWAACTRRS